MLLGASVIAAMEDWLLTARTDGHIGVRFPSGRDNILSRGEEGGLGSVRNFFTVINVNLAEFLARLFLPQQQQQRCCHSFGAF